MNRGTHRTTEPLEEGELRAIDAYWRAANYCSVGQIYLMDNPLLLQPLVPSDVKPRLLGHFGTTPGLNLIYAHLNRAITVRDLDMIYVIGPGHGGPGIVANAYLEGTYSEVYPHIAQDAEGLRRLFPPIFLSGRYPESCRTPDSRVHSRRRGARLLIGARLRCSTRQSEPHRGLCDR